MQGLIPAGVSIVKVYKSKNGKLVIYLPLDVISSLKIKAGDEVGFFKAENKSFLFLKNSDIVSMLQGQPKPEESRSPARQAASFSPALVEGQYQPSQEELSVLRKLDTIRYENRTQESILKILNESERKVFQKLVANSAVGRFKGKDGKDHYSIPKSIYDRFLMRKRPPAKEEPYNFVVPKVAPQSGQDDSIADLQKNGFIVLQTEAEASKVSLLLEQSIRHGQVLGTRSFSKNREFYILSRTYFDKYAQSILKKLRERSYKLADISKELGMDEEGARGILCILSESGDVMERKKELFSIA